MNGLAEVATHIVNKGAIVVAGLNQETQELVPSTLFLEQCAQTIVIDQPMLARTRRLPEQMLIAIRDSEDEGFEQRLAGYPGKGIRAVECRSSFSVAWTIPPELGDSTTRRLNVSAVEEVARLISRGVSVQTAGLVPVLGLQIERDGYHSLGWNFAATRWLLQRLFELIERSLIETSSLVIQVNMITQGTDWGTETAQEIATATLSCMGNTVPWDFSNVMLLANGQTMLETQQHWTLLRQQAAVLRYKLGSVIDPEHYPTTVRMLRRYPAQRRLAENELFHEITRYIVPLMGK